MSTQFLMWDKFKDMKKLSQVQREHLSTLLSQLLSSKAMSLSVLKVRITLVILLRTPSSSPLVIFPQSLRQFLKITCTFYTTLSPPLWLIILLQTIHVIVNISWYDYDMPLTVRENIYFLYVDTPCLQMNEK